MSHQRNRIGELWVRAPARLHADALSWLEARGIAGVGQGGWGPTGFAIPGDAAEARLK